MKAQGHLRFLRLALRLAQRARGHTSPNPMVGAVIVKDERIIAERCHRRFGGAHAEINALNNAEEGIRGATLYVNLEPCSHHGKTPPCVDAVIAAKPARVVIGTADPNPLVAGRGTVFPKEETSNHRIPCCHHYCSESPNLCIFREALSAYDFFEPRGKINGAGGDVPECILSTRSLFSQPV